MAKKPSFVGTSSSGLTQAQLFEAQGLQILHIGIRKDPTAEEIAWANGLLAKPNMQGVPLIVSTHDYIDGGGQSTRVCCKTTNILMVFMTMICYTSSAYR